MILKRLSSFNSLKRKNWDQQILSLKYHIDYRLLDCSFLFCFPSLTRKKHKASEAQRIYSSIVTFLFLAFILINRTKPKQKKAILSEENRISPLPTGVLTPPQSSKKQSSGQGSA